MSNSVLIDINYWFYKFLKENEISLYVKLDTPDGLKHIKNLHDILNIKNDSWVRILFDNNLEDITTFIFYNKVKNVNQVLYRKTEPFYYKNILMAYPINYLLLDSYDMSLGNSLDFLNGYEIDLVIVNKLFEYKRYNQISDINLDDANNLLEYMILVYLNLKINNDVESFKSLVKDINNNVLSFLNPLEYVYYLTITNDLLKNNLIGFRKEFGYS